MDEMLNDVIVDPIDQGPLGTPTVPKLNLEGPQLLGCEASAIGRTEMVIPAGASAAYPVVEGIPILMRTERLSTTAESVQVGGTYFEEGYQEQELYAGLASDLLGGRGLEELRYVINNAQASNFPNPLEHWFGGGSIAAAYGRALKHIAPVAGEVVLQIGGIGTHALKLLHAGADSAIVVSPVVGELITGRAIARELGFDDRIVFVAGVAEELPIESGAIGAVISESSMHHTDTRYSFSEIDRVLKNGGRWASTDVWLSKFHDFGTGLFGKCHGNEYCKPLSNERLEPLSDLGLEHERTLHGGSLRYVLAVAERAGLRPGPKTGVNLAVLEERIPLGPLEETLSSFVCLTGRKSTVLEELI